MAIDLIENLENKKKDRPIKGLSTDLTVYKVEGLQYLLDQQSIDKLRVAGLLAFCVEENKFVIFDNEGLNYELKDLPSGVDLDDYVKKYSKAELNYLNLAYDGKYGSERKFYPLELQQDFNGWTQFKFTGYLDFKTKDKATGVTSDTVLELRPDRVLNKKQPYFNDYKLAVRANNNIVNTSSLDDLINSEGNSVKDWEEENPDYTPQDLLNQIFNSKVVGVNDFQVEITLSNKDYNGTVPNKYGKWIIRRSSDITRGYMYVHVKESSKVYRASYIAGSDPVWSLMAYVSNIDEIVDDRLDSIFNPSPSIDIELKNQNFSDNGYDINYGNIVYNSEYIQFPRFNNTIAECPHYSGFNNSYVLIRVEDVERMIGRNLDQNDNELGIDLTYSNGALGKHDTTLPNNAVLGAKWDYSGKAIAKLMPTNPDGSSDGTEQDSNNPYLYLKSDGSTTENSNEAKSATYSRKKLKKIDSFFGRKWGFALRRGYVKSDRSFIYNSESNYYVCVFNISNALEADKHHTFNFDPAEAKIYQSVVDAEMAGNAIINESEVSSLIESNNDEIITPAQGTQFQLIDDDKSSGYGDNGEITYYPVDYSNGQSNTLINHLENSKSYFVHNKTGVSKGFAILHQSYVSQIYNRDLNGVSELTMIFGVKSRGRLCKNNQTTPEGMVLNWNGEYLPDTENPNELNPSSWIDLNGNVTTDWSSTGVKTACYSIGLLANNGSALLQRGDVFCDNKNGVKSSYFVKDINSEFFVIPINTGGGTFNDLKLFPLFMSRFYKSQYEWDSYTFENSSDAIGTLLQISYESAIENTNDVLDIQNELTDKASVINLSNYQKPKKNNFINNSTVTVEYPLDLEGNKYRPNSIKVGILDVDNVLNDLELQVQSNDVYNGMYNNIGSVCIDDSGEWSLNTEYNAYKKIDSVNTYCVYSDSLSSWVLVQTNTDHNNIGVLAGGNEISLDNDGLLPMSYGDYTLSSNLSEIGSEFFSEAIGINPRYYDDAGYFTVSFGDYKETGIVFYK